MEREFKAYWDPLENVMAFRYLVQVLTPGDDDCIVVIGNLGKSRKSWGWLSWILSQEGVDMKVLGQFYKAVFLFGSET